MRRSLAALAVLAISTIAASPAVASGTAPRGTGIAEWAMDPPSWDRRRKGLIAGVTVSGAATVAGLLALVPIMVASAHPCGECDGTPYVGSMIASPLLMTMGATATTITGSMLAHHLRWDRATASDRTRTAKLARKRLRIALGVFAGLLVAGGVSIGLGYAAAAPCDFHDAECKLNRALVGYYVGGPLIVGGTFGTLSSGLLLGLHHRHRHGRAREVRVAPHVGGVAIRF